MGIPQSNDDTPTREVKDVNTFFSSFFFYSFNIFILLWVLLFPRTSIGLEYPTTVLRAHVAASIKTIIKYGFLYKGREQIPKENERICHYSTVLLYSTVLFYFPIHLHLFSILLFLLRHVQTERHLSMH